MKKLNLDLNAETIQEGVSIRVDINTLIQKVHVAPKTPKWFFDLLKGVIQKYNYDFELIESELNIDPIF